MSAPQTGQLPESKPGIIGAAVAAVSRAAGHIKSRYDAAGMGRRLSGWMPASSGPNRAIVGLQNIRNRARDVGRNKLTFDEHGEWTGKWELDEQGNPIPFICHSFVADGRIQFLSDCTHALAGQTIDLPEFKGRAG